MTSIDDEWTSFFHSNDDEIAIMTFTTVPVSQPHHNTPKSTNAQMMTQIPAQSSNLYISTQTKIAYLNTSIDLVDLFWRIPIQDYGTPRVCFIKKQMKFNSFTEDQVEIIHANVQKEIHPVTEEIIAKTSSLSHKATANTFAETTHSFKDVRKVSVGMSRKDLTTYHIKKKSAFYNCFIVIIRVRMPIAGVFMFKEFHVKIFNTGKVEIPGVQTQSIFDSILDQLIGLLMPLFATPIQFHPHTDTVLINSDFKCGFYLKREVLYELLKKKYGLQCIYDPCSYPGIHGKFYFDKDREIQNGVQELPMTSLSTSAIDLEMEIPSCMKMKQKHKGKYVRVSFMIFRTGSVLIVGMCNETIVNAIYSCLRNILETEYEMILQENHGEIPKGKKKKARRRTIILDNGNGNGNNGL